MKHTYLNKNKEKVLDFARELSNDGEISKQRLEEVYFKNYIAKSSPLFDKKNQNMI